MFLTSCFAAATSPPDVDDGPQEYPYAVANKVKSGNEDKVRVQSAPASVDLVDIDLPPEIPERTQSFMEEMTAVIDKTLGTGDTDVIKVVPPPPVSNVNKVVPPPPFQPLLAHQPMLIPTAPSSHPDTGTVGQTPPTVTRDYPRASTRADSFKSLTEVPPVVPRRGDKGVGDVYCNVSGSEAHPPPPPCVGAGTDSNVSITGNLLCTYTVTHRLLIIQIHVL